MEESFFFFLKKKNTYIHIREKWGTEKARDRPSKRSRTYPTIHAV